MLQEGSCICTARFVSSTFPLYRFSSCEITNNRFYPSWNPLKLNGSLIILVILFIEVSSFSRLLCVYSFLLCLYPVLLPSSSHLSIFSFPSRMSVFHVPIHHFPLHSLPSSNKVPIKLTLPLLHLTVANRTELALQGSVKLRIEVRGNEKGEICSSFSVCMRNSSVCRASVINGSNYTTIFLRFLLKSQLECSSGHISLLEGSRQNAILKRNIKNAGQSVPRRARE